MNNQLKLNCPVCGYKEIDGKTCPNCETDLSLIRTLQDLAPVEKTSLPKKISNLPLLVTLLILTIGIGLGVGGSFLLIQNQYSINLFAHSSTKVNNSETLINNPKLNIYRVKPGDNLGVIAEKVCGKASAWRLIAEANPHLENRRNYFINVGEKLKVPQCQEKK
ncbi:LysM peptidoglycan-binding domain-containing protein [Anabaena sp. UHCC 0451]|uniref:LysM peptidoglycan-binding domain-containing protein n=1 Tax=Anabaena sp. UHCC 0451 TaxID=2055235 RepID=UPI002B219D30|nr:LysM peptidoglycan-binding domain-containing protein [Anabaena sp. UHCC 0451]MEA5576814.1 LysM peptidoglycan-binding domain-containing protein [Anabaena sp. UHCC 0451]